MTKQASSAVELDRRAAPYAALSLAVRIGLGRLTLGQKAEMLERVSAKVFLHCYAELGALRHFLEGRWTVAGLMTAER